MVTVKDKEYFSNENITMKTNSIWNLSALLKTYVEPSKAKWSISDSSMGYVYDGGNLQVLDKTGTFTLTVTVGNRSYSKKVRVVQ